MSLPESRASRRARNSAVRVRLAAAVALVVATACWPFGDDDQLAPMEIRGDGRVQLIRGDEVIDVEGRAMLEIGDVVRTGKNASATLRLEGEREAELIGSSTARILSTAALQNMRGGVLARTRESMRVRFGSVDAASSDAIFRVDNGFAAARVGVYEGSVDLAGSAQESLRIPELFEAQVAAHDVPNNVKPYRLHPSDPWDQVYLEDVLALDKELTQLGRGLTTQLGRSRVRLQFFRPLARGRSVAFIRPYIRRPVDDLVIGFTVARNAPELSVARAFDRAFSLFDQGARWGLVATIMDVRSGPLLAQLERTIVGPVARGEGGAAVLAADDDTFVGGGAPPPPPPPGGPDPEPPDRDDGDDNDDPRPRRSPPPPPSPPPCSDPVQCLTEDIVPSPPPTAAP